MTENTGEIPEKEPTAGTSRTDLEKETDPIKRAIGLGALIAGIYLMDRLLGEEEIITTKDNRQIKINRTFIDEILE